LGWYEVGFPQGSLTMQSIFLSCVFFPFWTQLENSTTKGGKKNHVHQFHHKRQMEISSQVFLLMAIIKNRFFFVFLATQLEPVEEV
jgi:hypothetical protein